MKKWFMVILLLSLSVLALPQRAPRKAQKQAASKTLEGVTIEKNKATLKPDYEFVRVSDNEVAVKHKKKKKKDVSGTLKCGCVGSGGCSLQSSGGQSYGCFGSCGEGCTLLVTVGKQVQ